MNTNLLTLIDRLTFAPLEAKSNILSILLSENTKMKKSALSNGISRLVIKLAVAVRGKEAIKNSYRKFLLNHPDLTEEVFLELLDVIVKEEPLYLIQDLLYAVYVSKWVYNPKDADVYFEKFFNKISLSLNNGQENPK